MRKTLVTLSLMASLLPLSAPAQELTDEELLKLFLAQRDAFAEAGASDTGQTRSLKLITVQDVSVTTETATLGTPSSTGTDTGLTSSDGTGVVVSSSPDSLAAPEGDSIALSTDAPQPADQLVAVAAGPKDPTVIGVLDTQLQVNVRIEFDYDSAALTDGQKPKLDQMCSVMKVAPINLFRITGHTDASGPEDYNQNLSLLRAQEVQRYLINNCGIDPGRLEAVGLGERFIPDGSDPRAAEHRRVEFQAMS